MAKIRTINQTFDAIKHADPETAISRHAIRQAVLNGEIPSRKAGQKFLIDMDQVLRYFGGEELQEGAGSV